jgi:hypothetical protein
MAFCIACGAQSAEGASFCGKCGTRISSPRHGSANESQEPREANEGDRAIQIFVGKNYHRFKTKWEAFEQNRFLQAWSWPAALLGPSWAAYRKMYLYAFIWTASELVVALGMELRNPSAAVPDYRVADLLVFLAFTGIGGFYGAKLYQLHVRKRVQVALTNKRDEIELARMGGTNLSAGILFSIIILALYFIFVFALLYSRGELPKVE